MTAKVNFKIGGMMCSFCTETIQKALTNTKGVKEVNVNMAHEEALITYDPEIITPGKIKDVLSGLGYTIKDPKKLKSFEEEERLLKREKRRVLAAGTLSIISFSLMSVMWSGIRSPYFKWIMLTLAVVTLFGLGRHILIMAYRAGRKGIANQHVLLSLGAIGALGGGLLGFFLPAFPIPDFLGVTVFLTTYHILSGYVSALVKTRSSQAVRKLLEMQPQEARVVVKEGEKKEEERTVPIEEIRRGDIVLVLPGERIPVDGEVVEGHTSVDFSLVTGEPLPVDVSAGGEVIGGSINGTGAVKIRVTRTGEESFLFNVARHVEEAKALKPGILQLVDRILKYFVPGVIFFSAGALLFWILAGWIFQDEPNYVRGIYAAISVLVMGYPCALGMATPLAIIRGSGMAAGKGILMRSGDAFQVFKDVRKIVIDKTGTLTKGLPTVREVVTSNDFKREELLSLVASAERRSEHPLARAVVEYVSGEDIPIYDPEEFEAVPGQGVRAWVNGKIIRAGTRELVSGGVGRDLDDSDKRAEMRDEVLKKLDEIEGRGNTSILVSVDDSIAGVIAISDVLKEDAKEFVSRLKEIGIEPVMVTGDNEKTAQSVALEVGIREVFARVLPDEKSRKIRELQQQGYRTAMVGDGINDAPALMQADVGIAIGAGTDIAIESSDIVIVGDRLNSVIDAFHISRNSYKKTVQNLVLAFSFNGIGIPLATTGLVHPAWAMVAMALSVSTVLLNSFGVRLKGKITSIPAHLGFKASHGLKGKITSIPAHLGFKAKERDREKTLKRIGLTVPTMHCESCLFKIRKVLKKYNGIRKVEGRMDTKELIILHDGSVSEDMIRKAISEAGYGADSCRR